ncbi:hypothetical protein GCM10023156_49250 [Novipirellula rosea]|uniref:Uncharacterized protein n=2 Tax=Novipirellula rosea TaxID=1031540 RepID=A0ABP8ND03_9BACT
MTMPKSSLSEFDWKCQPQAAMRIDQWTEEFVRDNRFVANLQTRMLEETGTRLSDWLDHISLPFSVETESLLSQSGFQLRHEPGDAIWQHPDGLFPDVVLGSFPKRRLTIQVESVVDFLVAHRVTNPIQGRPYSSLRLACVSETESTEFWVAERHGDVGFKPSEAAEINVDAILKHQEAFLLRQRDFASDEEGFAHARALIDAAKEDLGQDRTCDLFFAAERRYWESRNRAARVQKSRQDELGLGWANHDHHTYRSSRKHFPRLISLLEQLGFQCRERFYGGAEAGWGAQVLEQPATGVVIFADVDLTAEEVSGDFAHEPLPPRDQLGTVGLWCKLHGEAVLQAGMHHLECQFDFDAARTQLAERGIQTMAPFTDFDFLKQAFTQGEMWPVADGRIEQAASEGVITAEQAERFRKSGSIGSHLEILQRDDGYKGFNQTGINEIIRKTDPRYAR